MDGLRSQFGEYGDSEEVGYGSEGTRISGEEAQAPQPPQVSPLSSSDERRMQVRAYNFWAGMLGNSSLPSVEDLEPADVADFGPYSVLLDFSEGSQNPAVTYIGDELATECSIFGRIRTLAEVPKRSLLSRISDHYLQILANRAPIGFEAEFLNQSGLMIMYRGVLLPFSSDGDQIDFVYGVINWKDASDEAQAVDALELQIDQAIEPISKLPREATPITDWADGPVDADAGRAEPMKGEIPSFEIDDLEPLDLSSLRLTLDPEAMPDRADLSMRDFDPSEIIAAEQGLPVEPAFQSESEGPMQEAPAQETGAQHFGQPADELPTASQSEVESETAMDGEGPLERFLAAARELAQTARGSEDRSRQALYAAVGRAHDFALVADEEPEAFRAMVEQAGLPFQERAPLTPLVKLVFGADHDKTRLAEFSAAISYALRVGIAQGELADYLGGIEGGLKAVVKEERNFRRKPVDPTRKRKARPRVTKALRKIEARPLADVAGEGEEFTVLVARRMETGDVMLVGEVADDAALLEKAARHLIG